MCGRFILSLDPGDLKEELGLGVLPVEMRPRYNIAPTQPVAVVLDSATRDVVMFHWGLVPFWAKDPSIGSRMINARAETVSVKPSFRRAFARRRCLLPADGYYEWYRPGDVAKAAKQPYYFCRADGGSLAFAGLY